MRLILYKRLTILFFSLLLLQCTIPEVEDVTPPAVGLLYPYDGSVVSGGIIVSVQATDDRGVESIWYTLDGKQIEKRTGSGYVFDLDVSDYADERQHVFQALASDESGNVGASDRAFVTISKTGDITPPTVEIINPADGQQLADSIRITVRAFDNEAVKKVVFFIDGDSLYTDTVYPYEFTAAADYNFSLGEHTLYVKACDAAGNFTNSDLIRINFVASLDRTPPTITLLYPLAGSTVTGTVDIAADIRDDAAVSRVEYFVDGGINGEPNYTSTSAPWYFKWNTAAWADSMNHTIYIKAFDSSGNTGTLGPISYVVE
jgi:hypothetical protein